jgi:hypothetical protein
LYNLNHSFIHFKGSCAEAGDTDKMETIPRWRYFIQVLSIYRLARIMALYSHGLLLRFCFIEQNVAALHGTQQSIYKEKVRHFNYVQYILAVHSIQAFLSLFSNRFWSKVHGTS